LIALIINVHTLGRMLVRTLATGFRSRDRNPGARTLDECCAAAGH